MREPIGVYNDSNLGLVPATNIDSSHTSNAFKLVANYIIQEVAIRSDRFGIPRKFGNRKPCDRIVVGIAGSKNRLIGFFR